MALILYIARAFMLLRLCFSSSYRAEIRARWKTTPQHRIIWEVGTGVLGVAVIAVIIAVIISGSRK
jgi:hypothetical protein